jgi:hypothetical protein
LANIHHYPSSTETKEQAKKPGSRIFMDLSKLTHPSLGGNNYWLLIVDDATDYCWSLFLKKRSETTTRTLQF